MPDKLNDLVQGENSFSLNITNPLPLETLAFYLATSNKLQEPQLVITETMEKARIFMENYSFWIDKKAYLLPYYNPNAFAGVQISRRQIQDRLSWFFYALNENQARVFVAPFFGLLQKTMKPDLFMDGHFQYFKGDNIPPDFFEKLHRLGYLSSPMVEDPGCFANRGGLIDLFSPQMEFPVRMELFGDEIENLRIFDPSTQRTISEIEHFLIIPAREVLLNEKNCFQASQELLKFDNPDLQTITNSLRCNRYCENLEYHLPLFYEKTATAFQYFQKPPCVWILEELDLKASYEKEMNLLNSSFNKNLYPLSPSELFSGFTELKESFRQKISLEKLSMTEVSTFKPSVGKTTVPFMKEVPIQGDSDKQISFLPCEVIKKSSSKKFNEQMAALCKKLKQIPEKTYKIFSVKGKSQFDRMNLFFENQGHECSFHNPEDFQWENLFRDCRYNIIHFFPRKLKQSFFLNSKNLAVFSLEHFFGKSFQRTKKDRINERSRHLSFGELKENDYILHAVHGICQFKGLSKMFVTEIEAEFLQLEFKDKDKLFLPIYRIHQISKYSSERIKPALDKLGGTRFSNIKTKTKKRLKEIAHDLIKLYAKRSLITRPVYPFDKTDINDFFNAFAYQETEDQIKAIEDIVTDLTVSEKPMDRLICGDVGFGKTEVAMRAAFIVTTGKKQVAILVPTTVLTMQHFETFRKRFKNWPINIQVINRLQSPSKIKKTLAELARGDIDILIGTHRLLSQDVEFKSLGLLVIDEEQKFGVKDKERIRKMKTHLDTLSLSATPIPRTLNMSLLKIRDLSLINTAPADRLETQTFICHFNKDLIKRAIETEVGRGGQVFFIHNKIQTIENVARELRQWIPEVSFAVAHGQMKKKDLESVIISFFNNKIQVLIASTIIESGTDRPNANTIFINQADHFGLSQLYQLRGRVGRSTQRAYCYLIIEQQRQLTDIAKERLRVIQENSSLGSGIQIAQYDLELRGTGTLLGEEQSGLIDSMGYEFYMQLLEEAIKEANGEKQEEMVEPEINLKIRAFIPDSYIANIRLRLSYYRALTQIKSPSDIDNLEEELKDQFGNPPKEVINLLGIMLIRHQCLQLGVSDISNTRDSLILKFTENTPLSTSHVIDLTHQPNKKYSITPNNRLKIRIREITWPRVQEEMNFLLNLCSQ